MAAVHLYGSTRGKLDAFETKRDSGERLMTPSLIKRFSINVGLMLKRVFRRGGVIKVDSPKCGVAKFETMLW